jgi:hypothetical protein
MLTYDRIYKTIETLDWGGHVELPTGDMQWLAGQLYMRLNATEVDLCDACNKPAPLVLQTTLGNICAECLEDMNENIDQMRDVMGDDD